MNRVVVLGATGSVGRAILGLIDERAFCPLSSIVALASSRSAGKEVSVGELGVLPVESAEGFTFQKGDLVFSALGADAALQHVPRAQAAGAFVIDKSAAFRNEAPLVIPEINSDVLKGGASLVCSPNCVAIPLVLALHPLHQEFDATFVSVATYQSVSGAGKKGMDALFTETRAFLMAGSPKADNSPLGGPIAFNVLPTIGSLDDAGVSDEEQKIRDETRRFLGEDVDIVATAVRVPTFIGHGMAVTVSFNQAIQASTAADILESAPGVVVAQRHIGPTDIVSEDLVKVARIRQVNANTLAFWVVGDNLRKGAALNAIQIAEARRELY